MSRQVQCINPNCGSFHVDSKPTRIHRITGEWAPTFREAFIDIFGLAFWGFLGFIVLSLIVVVLEMIFKSGGVRTLIGVLYLIATIILVIVVLFYVVKNFWNWAQSYPATHYQCRDCPTNWNERRI